MDSFDKWFTRYMIWVYAILSICGLRSLTLVTVMGILFLFWVQNSEHHLGVNTQPKLVLGDTT